LLDLIPGNEDAVLAVLGRVLADRNLAIRDLDIEFDLIGIAAGHLRSSVLLYLAGFEQIRSGDVAMTQSPEAVETELRRVIEGEITDLSEQRRIIGDARKFTDRLIDRVNDMCDTGREIRCLISEALDAHLRE